MTKVLRIVPWSSWVRDSYVGAAKAHGREVAWPNQGVFVLDEDNFFVCGVGLFEAGPFLLAENLVTNPESKLKTRHLGVALCIQTVMRHAVVTGKVLRMFVESPGLIAMLKKAGCQEQMAVPMFWSTLDLAFPVLPRQRHTGPARTIPAGPTTRSRTPKTVALVDQIVKRGRRKASVKSGKSTHS